MQDEVGHANTTNVGVGLVSHAVGDVLSDADVVGVEVEAHHANSASDTSWNGLVGHAVGRHGDAESSHKDEGR